MTARLMILNGPNLNLLGVREPHIYGSTTLAAIKASCEELAKSTGVRLSFHQSNHEGALVDLIQAAREEADAIIINPAGYSFTSIAIFDALKIFEGPIIEVHISNIHARDELHRHSKLSSAVRAVICGARALRLHRRDAGRAAGAGKVTGEPAGADPLVEPEVGERRTMQGSGYLAIWSDLAPEHETDWMHWMTREHSSERVGVEGFLACRIFRAYGLSVRAISSSTNSENARWSAARLSGAAQCADAVVAAHHAAAAEFRRAAAERSWPQPESGKADTSPRCRSRRPTSIRPRWCANSRRSIASRRFVCCRPTRHKPRSRRARRACARPTARSAVSC
jgi:3-dehydroquinate dehydratase-2